MTDLFLTEGADLALHEGDLVLDLGLGSAVLRSLFTDARAAGDELERVGADDPRGWWGSDESDEWGSTLWLLAREKATQETRARAEGAARRALEWLIDDGVAESVEVTASFPERGQLSLEVRVVRGSASRWAHLWERTDPAALESRHLTIAATFEG